MKKPRTLSRGRSIRSQTLFYFMTLSLILISLLWAMQEWFFSTRFIPLKQEEIVKLLDDAVYDNPIGGSGTEKGNAYFQDLYDLSVKNNLQIYYFGLRSWATVVEADADAPIKNDQRPLLTLAGAEPLFTAFRVLSPWTEYEKSYFDSNAQWGENGAQLSRFIYLTGYGIDVDAAREEYDDSTGRLYYAAECKNHTNSHNYFVYAEAIVTKEGVTLSILRFEFVMITCFTILLTILFSAIISQFLANPISRISKGAERLARGDFSVRIVKGRVSELNKLADTLNYAAVEIGKTEQFRRDFIANLSHDLRTPLTLIRAYAEMLRDLDAKPEKRRQSAQTIIDEADRLSGLVADIQDFSKLQAGVETINSVAFGLIEFCRGILNRFAAFCSKNNFSIDFSFGDEDNKKEIFVFADRDKIAQVLYNLIGNALNYAGESKRVMLRIVEESKSSLVEIIDHGKGIPENEIDSVWERYYRANQAKRTVVGSGLGLSIVKEILVAHKADHGIKSELGKGTTFWFRLPLATE